MSNRTRVEWFAALPAALVLVLGAGCAKQDTGGREDGAGGATQELAWARSALERNPQLEVVATDTTARTFTVKHRGSGEVQVVSLDKLAAAPIADLTAATAATPADAGSPPAMQPAAATPAPQPVASATPNESVPPAETISPGETRYTIQREGGQLRVSGPGVSIVSASAAAPSSAIPGGASVADSPIVCEDGRFMHLDGRNLRVDGTAVTARNGCELHITNSTIQASGTAIDVQNATVHISNSEIRGRAASLAANGKARLYVRSSTFQGIARRNDPAEINDQGGNTWR